MEGKSEGMRQNWKENLQGRDHRLADILGTSVVLFS
jgi:hypothetical protein